ncbi:MAG: nitrilase-related carbon-nitrogen hydrolase [Terriglobia bacterium]
MAECFRYFAALCQTDHPNPLHRSEMKRKTESMVQMLENAVIGYAPFMPVRLVVFPEFGHAAPAYVTLKELREHLAVPIPNEHTDRMQSKAKEFGLYIQTASLLESDEKWPGAVFNTTCLIGPEGILYKYRKVNPWIPWEVHTSPHDIEGYDEELFPVAKTPIGNIGAAICYDWLFPETLRQLAAKGAEILVRVSAYMDPFGTTEPMDWWTVVTDAGSRISVTWWPSTKGPASSITLPFRGPVGAWRWISTEGFWSRRHPVRRTDFVVAPIDIQALREARKCVGPIKCWHI